MSEPADLGQLEPPSTIGELIRRLGPGLILVGNIVGSGELIATPALSAEAGYSFLWLILFSCFIKVCFQIEIGRYAISERRTTLDAFNAVPGPRWRVNWLVWYWFLMMASTLVQTGGMCGGVAQALRIAMPLWSGSEAADARTDLVWTIVTGASVAILLLIGRYRMIEMMSLALVTLFTIITFYSVAQLQFTPDYAVSLDDIRSGFSFEMPKGGNRTRLLGLALMAFGITGVGASELVMYPYWCLEKGYGRFVGPRAPDDSWAKRARGWIRVMHVDAWLSMVVFTTATLAFYLLGAALLHERFLADPHNIPKGSAMVSELSHMYRQSFGAGARYVFLVGAICVLYSTFFIATAANSRMIVDWLGLMGIIDRGDEEKRRLGVACFSAGIPVFAVVAYLLIKEPVVMVMVSGVMQALMLPMIGVAVLLFAHRWTDRRIRGGWAWYGMLWTSFLLMSLAALYMAYNAVAEKLASKPAQKPSATAPEKEPAAAALVIGVDDVCQRDADEPDADNRPNIVWIFGEDMGPDLGCYGYPLVRTPRLDGLAKAGVRYDWAFTTAPVCSTSRSALATGMYQTAIGAKDHRSHRDDHYRLPAPVVPITNLLRDAGYFTVNARRPAPGVQTGGKTDYNFTAPDAFDGGDWTERKPGQPFFAQISFNEPHRGKAWPEARMVVRPLIPPDDVEKLIPPYYPNVPIIRDDWANYLDAINLLDIKVGKALDRLESEGLLKSTIVIFVGDNGRCHPRDKQFLYDGGLRVPLIIMGPGIPEGAVNDDLVSAMDVSATTLALAGVTPPEWMQGRVLLGPKRAPARDAIFAARDRCDETEDRIRCVRTKQWKYIRNFEPERPYAQSNAYKERSYPGWNLMKKMNAEGKLTPAQALFWAKRRPAEELYDLSADPHEIHNRANDPAASATIKELRGRLEQWMDENKDR